jgi:phosphoribosylglycinamide formyltransferase-1
LERAAVAGIPAVVVDWRDHRDREPFTTAVCDAADAAGAEALILAGFMRILGAEAVRRFPDRILNTHPALSPAFPGAHAIRDALDYGVKVTGVTVHFVDEQVDHGPIIAQEAVVIEPGDGEADVQARIQAIEHRLYPDVIDAFAKGNLTIGGRKVVWS